MTKTRDLADLGGGFIQAGTGAVQRTVESKLQDVVSVKDFGAVGDGVTDDTVAIQAALNSGATSVTFPKGEYKFTAQLNVPAGTNIRSSGAVLKCAYTQTGTAAAVLFGANCIADSFSVNLDTGFTFRRLVSLGAGVKIDRLSVTSTDQINNRTSTLDGAVKLGADNQIDILYVARFDNSVDGFEANNTSINTVLCESYVRGVHLGQCSRVNISTLKAYTASANATTDPGHNGLLLEQVTNSCFGTVSVSDCGEHAVRIGSGTTAATENVSFDTIQAIRPGQCGFKINDDTYLTKGVSVGSIYTVDCAATTTTGSNEDSVRIERAQDVMIGSVLALRKNKTTSANVGLYLNGVDRVFVGSLQIEAPNEYGVHIEDTRGSDNSSIGIGTLNVYGNAKLPVYINSPTRSIKDIVIHDGYFRDCLSNAANIQIVNTGGTPEPCIFNVKVNVSNWTSPGSVTAANLVSNTAGSGRVYNQCTPHA